MNKITVEQRVKRALERYPFLDEVTVEDSFYLLNKLGTRINLERGISSLMDAYNFEDDEALNLYKAFLESDTIIVDKKPICDDVIIGGGEKLEFIALDTLAMAWGKGDNIPEAISNLSKSKSDFTSLDSDDVQVWLVSAGTTVSGVGSFNYSVDFVHPTRIK